MRDIFVTAVVFGSLPFILHKPFIGILVWTWLGLMNPHRLCWGFAVGMPFAYIVAVTLLGALLCNRQEQKKIPWTNISVTLAVFWFWIAFTTPFALYPTGAWPELEKISKIQLMVFVTMMLLTSRKRIHALVWVMVVSLGLYGVKGGIFTLLTGGAYHVMGPFGSFIGGNNEIGLALIMTIPLMRYLQMTSSRAWIKVAMVASMGLTFVAILGTQSRGALVGLAAMVAYLVMKSRRRVFLLIFMIVVLPLGYNFMPDSWHDRMATIETYRQDKSAEGRINAWWTAYNAARDRPIVGAGLDAFQPFLFQLYAPDPDNVHDAHSIYFEVLGELGFGGLSLFLTLGFLAIRSARAVVRTTKRDPSRFWMRDLASMIHVSLIGYAASGAFLGLAYFDFLYDLLAVLVGLQVILRRRAMDEEQESVETQEMQIGRVVADVYVNRARAATPAARQRLGLLEWYNSL